jgi:acetolactate decarboxylase
MGRFRIGFCVILVFTLVQAQVKRNDELVQVSTIDALLGGIYDGEVNIGQLLKSGNFGLGTFNSLDGEMVTLDGICYQIKADGNVYKVSSSLKTPFAAVTFFETDIKVICKDTLNLNQLQQKIDSLIPSPNYLYAIKVTGNIISATARSVPAQKPPYKPLVDVTREQPTFSFTNIKGTLAGFRCPQYVNGLNVPGYHLHLLTQDRKAGGHLLSLVADGVTIEIDQSDSYRVILPHDKEFSSAVLTGNKEEELKKVEK